MGRMVFDASEKSLTGLLGSWKIYIRMIFNNPFRSEGVEAQECENIVELHCNKIFEFFSRSNNKTSLRSIVEAPRITHSLCKFFVSVHLLSKSNRTSYWAFNLVHFTKYLFECFEVSKCKFCYRYVVAEP